jgi:hypothetical protein
MLKKIKWIASVSAVLQICVGYLDPGSGSFILQILAAAFLGLLLSGKIFWHRIIAIIKRTPKIEPEDDDE